MRPESLTILGLGPLGVDAGHRARAAGVPRVIGWSASRAEGTAAATAGAVHDIAGRVDRAAEGAQLVLVAVPFGEIGVALERTRRSLAPGAVVAVISELLAPIGVLGRELGLGGQVVAIHPFTDADGRDPGSPVWTGVRAYVAGAADAPTRSVMGFVEEVLGGEVVRIDPARHDAQVAWTRALGPTSVAALAHLLGGRELGGVTWARGLADLLKLRPADPAAWSELLVASAPAVADALAAFGGELERLRRLVEAGDREGLERYLREGGAFRPGLR